MSEIFNFSGIELIGFILIVGGAILIEENADFFNSWFRE